MLVRRKHVMVGGKAAGLYLLLGVLLMAAAFSIPHTHFVEGDTSGEGLVLAIGNETGQITRVCCEEDSKQCTNH